MEQILLMLLRLANVCLKRQPCNIRNPRKSSSPPIFTIDMYQLLLGARMPALDHKSGELTSL
jgi:hypothetical protein